MNRALVLMSAAGLAASAAMAQTAPPSLEFVVRSTDAIPGISDAGATFTGSNNMFTPSIHSNGNVGFRANLTGAIAAANPLGGTVATGTAYFYGGVWTGTGGTGTMAPIARLGYGWLPTGGANLDASGANILSNGMGGVFGAGNSAPAASGPYGLPTSLSYLQPNLAPNGRMLVAYGGMTTPTAAQFTAGNRTVNGITSGSASAPVRQTNNRAAWQGFVTPGANATQTNDLSLIVQTNDLAVNTNGSVYNGAVDNLIPSQRIDNQGRFLNFQSLRPNTGDTGANGTNDGALYYGSSQATTQMIFRLGTNNTSAWNQTSGNVTQVDYSWLPVSGSVIGSWDNNQHANGAGEVVTGIRLREDAGLGVSSTNWEVLARRSSTGVMSVIGQEGTPTGIPGINFASTARTGSGFFVFEDTVFNTASHAAFANDGKLLYGTILANGSGGSSITAGVNDQAVMIHSPSGGNKIFRQKGDAAPFLDDDFDPVKLDITTNTGSLRLNNSNQVVWNATLTGAGVNTAAGAPNTSSALYLSALNPDGSVASDTLLARRGDPMPGGLSHLRWGNFSSVLLNNAGQIVFQTTTQNALGSTTNMPTYLMAWDPMTGFQKILATGDIFNGMPIGAFSLNTNTSGENTNDGFTDNGWLAFRVGTPFGLNPAQSAIIRTQIVPAPGAGSLLALAGVAALRRRRRD
jgi:hypothetical protein